MAQATYMGPQILDDIVFFVTAGMPTCGSLTMDNKIVEDSIDNIVHCGFDVDSTRMW